MNIKSFLKDAKFKKVSLRLSTSGEYSWKDSEWNYSDVPHLNYVHTKVDGFNQYIGREFISNIFLQKIGPFSIPASISIQHKNAGKHSYCMTILSLVIYVTTEHLNIGHNKCTTNTKYEFYYQGIIGYLLAFLAKQATKRNYKVLMSEDMPMRNCRGKLREENFLISNDQKELIGFSDTINLNETNILKDPVKLRDILPINLEINDSTDTRLDELKLLIRKQKNELIVFPLICDHEGAPIECNEWNDTCNNTTICSWHGKQLKPLAKLEGPYPQNFSFEFTGINYQMTVNELTNTYAHCTLNFV